MEATFQTSLSPLRSKITIIEAIELAFLTFGIWCLVALVDISDRGIDFFEVFTYLIGLELFVLGSWMIYNVYIRIARAGGGRIDIALWIIASAFTGSYTFWAWTILDINRLLVAKLLYQGEAPVEYAWSARSKQIRKRWEQTQQASLD
jgi:nitrate reductase NapE component